MTNIVLRDVLESDLPIFFDQQNDPEANHMAAFPAREREPFMAHWKKNMGNKTNIHRTILADGAIAGNIVSFELEGERAFCPGVCGILRAVESTGSIKEAAASIGRSYRFVWGKIKQVEQALGCPLVETRVGGVLAQRSALTPAGEVLVSQFETLRRELFDFVDNKFAPRLQAALSRLEIGSSDVVDDCRR